ncbi:YncE family protein [Mucilaginibacter galii]|uniref:YncE family protein n=1 Tax=Mucilaginibacter galii TaxID=2005073 RepID=A0A917N182_9SPHI|nr:DUF5074 domain-containing protein [Mucilaginibacter galii]GGI50630.1 hypothetical protein GCM10011425_18420 [Mucilaginibacter galii]
MKKMLPCYSKTALTLLAGLTLFLGSCKKDDDSSFKEPEISSTKGVYMLCEGTYGSNNSDISYYDISSGTTQKNYYKKVNGSNLGETANDLQRYGSKMYCVITGIKGTAQSFVDVMDVATAKSIKRISFNSGNAGFCPRSIAFYQNKAYVSCYDNKVRRIDTASLSIDGEVTLSEGLEGLAVANGKLYVANSDHFQFVNGLKNVVSVINLSTFTKIKDIVVTYNPLKVAATATGNVYVISTGDYINVAPSLDIINSANDTKIQSSTGVDDYSVLSISGNKALLTTDIYSTDATVKNIDLSTGKIGNKFISDATIVTTFYGLTIDSFNNDVYVADANRYNSTTGKAICFGADGKIKFNFETAGLPQHAVFIYNYKK